MAEICITSGFDIKYIEGELPSDCFTLDETPEIGVICRIATGDKCERCWTYQNSGFDSEKALCSRCSSVLNSID